MNRAPTSLTASICFLSRRPMVRNAGGRYSEIRRIKVVAAGLPVRGAAVDVSLKLPIQRNNPMTVLILGCGYTGRRVALEMLSRNARVIATTTDDSKLRVLRTAGADVRRVDVFEPKTLEGLRGGVPQGTSVLLSVPLLRDEGKLFDPTPQLLEALGDRPARVIYLSTTGVYGRTREVDETTAVAPVTERQRLRVKAEEAIAGGRWPALILRPAAIYGPGRGVHVAMREGRFKLVGDGGNWVSRIHVDDLARHVVAALGSDLTGAFPVADEDPCTSREMAEFCSELLDLPMPTSTTEFDVDETRRSDRRVDGGAVRQALGVRLRYSSYKIGIPASLAAR